MIVIPLARYRTYALALGFCFLASEIGLAADPVVKWRTDYNAARKEANEKGRPLFLAR